MTGQVKGVMMSLGTLIPLTCFSSILANCGLQPIACSYT